MAHKASDLPIHIGEAADAAFATRLRQAASGSSVNHMPRVQYMTDDALRSLSDTSPVELPSASRLRYLIDVAMSTVCRVWHIVRRSVVNESVDKVLRDPSSCDWLSACRIWALLALGEAYSSRCVLPDTPFPGSKYFARAMAMIAVPSERPRLATIEIYVLLVCVVRIMSGLLTDLCLVHIRICSQPTAYGYLFGFICSSSRCHHRSPHRDQRISAQRSAATRAQMPSLVDRILL